MAKATCSIDECDRPIVARGWCSMHYQRWQFGNSHVPSPTDIERFWAKVHKTEGCWYWQGPLIATGYGRYNGHGAHRVAYELWVGPVPVALELDHLCRVRNCVNPDHLEPVTHAENMARSSFKTHCVHGHEYTEENTIRRREGGRNCRQCGREVNARSYAKRKARG